MGIIGTLYNTSESFTRFAFENPNVIAIHWGESGFSEGEEQIIGTAANFDEACRLVSAKHSPYGKNPNFRYEFSGKDWALSRH